MVQAAAQGLGLPNGEKCSLSHALEDREIAFVERKRVRGKNLEQADDRALVTDGRGCDGTNGESPADAGVDAEIDFGVVTTQSFSGADALARESLADVDMCAEGRSADPDAGAAHHGAAVDERDRGAAAAQESPGTFADDAQSGIQIGSERVELVLNRTGA